MSFPNTPPERFATMPPRAEPITHSGFMQAVYSWMSVGLLLTAVTAFWVMNNESILGALYGNRLLFYGLLGAELLMVVAFTALLNRVSMTVAAAMFLGYSLLNGITMAAILFLYTQSSVASTFFVTAGTFGAMSIYGYTTKRDLTRLGSLLFMALIGIILASVVNFFLKSTAIYWITTYVGILIFVGLIAYDTQKLREIHESGRAQGEQGGKLALRGALALYLDFINLFLLLLRVMGKRR